MEYPFENQTDSSAAIEETVEFESPDRSFLRVWGAVGGVVLTTILSTACCWVPLLFIVFGISAAGFTNTFFASMRPYMLGVTALCFGAAIFFMNSRKRNSVASCCHSSGRTKSQHATTIILVFCFACTIGAFFMPEALAYFSNRSSSAMTGNAEGTRQVELLVDGMACEGCALPLKQSLEKISGVLNVTVDYPSGKATLSVASNSEPSQTEIQTAVENAGFRLK